MRATLRTTVDGLSLQSSSSTTLPRGCFRLARFREADLQFKEAATICERLRRKLYVGRKRAAAAIASLCSRLAGMGGEQPTGPTACAKRASTPDERPERLAVSRTGSRTS